MSTDHNFWKERRAEVELNWGPSAYQPNALPLGQTSSPMFFKSIGYLYVGQSIWYFTYGVSRVHCTLGCLNTFCRPYCFYIVYFRLTLGVGALQILFYNACVSATMSVQKLRTLIQRLFHLDTDFTLSYISQKVTVKQAPTSSYTQTSLCPTSVRR